MDPLDRKAAKEAFVAGLSGTSKREVFALVATLSLSIVACKRLLLELLLVVLPHILLVTEALPLWPSLAALALATVASGGHVLLSRAGRLRLRAECRARLADLAGRRKGFVSAFRGALMASTAVCILAVDFTAFPRRLAKAEVYGTGLMDLGVGGVMLAAGLVSTAALPLGTNDGGDGASSEGGGAAAWRPAPLRQRLASGLRGAAACWALGLGRLASTRAVDYQAHVGEYGVHWNFFHTIAVVALLGQAVALPPHRLAAAAAALTAAHQAALTLGVYMAVVCGVAVLMDARGWRLKL
ncbi:GPI-anchored wall transfer protein 1 [Tetrabaena socialis]|uniref:GPI-anchored wall transfer protein 1 n=1 Tax=Tetrabaena socialis TaxID=47790 RepID=A0A2J8ABK6_9CHLO|nr:GPI-anchored wall transfer protein 1 [Tetrabaena socialis]|eukprot:PNH09908.1 GPI-anchored wall transfer protein 1 [Tetrabaena socialis]